MTTLAQVCVVVLVFAGPAAALWACRHSRLLNALGPVTVCYVCGIVWANVGAPNSSTLSLELATALVPVGISLLLFGVDAGAWLKLAPRTGALLVLAGACVVFAGGLGWLLLGHERADAGTIAGMLVATYTGGSPNMNAVGQALNLPHETMVLVNACDVAVGGVFYLCLLSFLPRVLRRLLGSSPDAEAGSAPGHDQPARVRFNVRHAAVGLAVAGAVVGASAGISVLLHGTMDGTTVLVCLTTLALVASLNRNLRRMESATLLGDYLMLAFCVATGLLADAHALAVGDVRVLAATAVTLGVGVGLQWLLARLMGLDADTAIMLTTATIFGPAFVPPIAKALRNPTLLAPGLTCALMGAAMGNYLGLAVARWLGP